MGHSICWLKDFHPHLLLPIIIQPDPVGHCAVKLGVHVSNNGSLDVLTLKFKVIEGLRESGYHFSRQLETQKKVCQLLAD